MGLDALWQDISDYVTWELEEGNVSAEVSADVMNALSKRGGSEAGEQPRHAAAGTAGGVDIPVAPAGATGHAHMPEGDSLAAIAGEVAQCKRCPLHEQRKQTVPGQGNPKPEIMFVGEAPGRDEDEQGLAFVGRAGKLLTKMIEAMGFAREDVFIGNINKCRPPDNRKPTPEEMATCLPFLKRQIAQLSPKVIVTLGATAIEGLVPLADGETISKVRGRWGEFEGIPLMPTYHPAYLLRNPAMKRPVWEDLKAVLKLIGRPVPSAAQSKLSPGNRVR